MKNWLLRLSLAAAALAVFSATSFAQINLSWDDCGSFGTLDKTFACNANSGTNSMVGTFITPNAPQFVGIEVYLDMITNQATLSPWWSFNTGDCHAGAATWNVDFTTLATFNCVDYWAGQASGGGGQLVNFLGVGPNTQRFKGIFAIPAEQVMDPGQEIYAFRLSISRSKTVGTGACAGCTDAACIVLNRIQVAQPAGVGDFSLTDIAPGGRNYVTWQGGTGANCATVPAVNRTWGQVKALYK